MLQKLFSHQNKTSTPTDREDAEILLRCKKSPHITTVLKLPRRRARQFTLPLHALRLIIDTRTVSASLSLSQRGLHYGALLKNPTSSSSSAKDIMQRLMWASTDSIVCHCISIAYTTHYGPQNPLMLIVPYKKPRHPNQHAECVSHIRQTCEESDLHEIQSIDLNYDMRFKTDISQDGCLDYVDVKLYLP